MNNIQKSLYSFFTLVFTAVVCAVTVIRPAEAGLPLCYAIPDNNAVLLTVVPNTASPPTSTFIATDQTFQSEGSGYRAVDGFIYTYQLPDDDEGPADLYRLDPATGVSTLLVTDHISAPLCTPEDECGVDAVEFAVDPTDPNSEVMYVVAYDPTASDGFRLFAFDPDDTTTHAAGFSPIAGYPVDLFLDNGAGGGIAGDGIQNGTEPDDDLSSLAFDTATQTMWGAKNNAVDVYTVDPATGAMTLQFDNCCSAIDAEGLSFAADGNLYIEDEGLNYELYDLNTTTGAITVAANLNPASGDYEAIMCNTGERSDLGDAPSSYGFVSHTLPVFTTVPLATYLGAVVPDDDNDLSQFNNATGDDSGGTDDEDGVASFPTMSITAASYTVPTTCVGTGTIVAWIDYDQNGTFDPDEESTPVACSGGTANVNWPSIPPDIIIGSSYARFRIASSASEVAEPDTVASDGEVEDYPITITQEPLIIDKTANPSGSVMPGDDITYTLRPSAPGAIVLMGVQVSDNTPDDTTYQGMDTPDADTEPSIGGTGLVQWDLGDVTANVPGSVAGSSGLETFFATQDNWIDSCNDDGMMDNCDDERNTNHGSATTLQVFPAGVEEDGEYAASRAIVQFDLSSIAAGTTINSATLVLQQTGVGMDAETETFNVHELNTSWAEGTSTWINPWTSPGGDFGAVLDGAAVATGTGIDISWTIPTTVIDNWVTTPGNNMGFLIKDIDENTAGGMDTEVEHFFASSENATAAIRPRLIIDKPGIAATTTTLSASPSLVTDGDTITITMTVTSDIAATNVTPAGLSISDPSLVAAASCFTPATATPTSQSISAGGAAVFTWTCTAANTTSTTPIPQTTFSSSATATETNVSFASGTSNSVIVSPELMFTVQVDNPLSGSPTSIDNTVNLTATSPVGVPPGTDMTSNPIDPTADADVQVVKTLVTPGPYQSGDTISYNIVVTNNGPDEASDVSVNDVAVGLSGITITSVINPDIDAGDCAAGSSFPCPIADMANGEVVTITVTATVD